MTKYIGWPGKWNNWNKPEPCHKCGVSWDQCARQSKACCSLCSSRGHWQTKKEK